MTLTRGGIRFYYGALCLALLFDMAAGYVVAATRNATSAPGKSVSFSRDIAPIFVKQCVVCHSLEKSKGEYQLDTFELALKAGASKAPPITPGHPEKSELYRLLTTKNDDDRMPQKADALSAAQIKVIEKWIKDGAKFDGSNSKASIASLIPKTSYPSPPEVYSRPVPVTALAFSRDGVEIAAGGYDEITVWSAADGRLVRRLKNFPQKISSLDYSPDGTLLAVAGGSPGEAGEVRLVKPATGATVKSLATLPDVALVVRFSPDGARLAAGGADNAIHIFEVVSGKEQLVIRQHADWVMDLAFSADGSRLVSASRDRSARVYDAKTGELQVSFLGHEAPVFSVAFNEDGETVYSAGRDKKIRIWNAKTGKSGEGKKSAEISGFENDIFKLAVVSNRLFSCSADGQARLHNTADRSLVRTFSGHTDWVYTLAVHPQSHRFATGSHDGEVRIWSFEDGKTVTAFKAAPGLLTAKRSK